MNRMPHIHPTPRHRRRGLTLIELMVVAGIIVIVLALSVPALQVWDSRKKTDALGQVSGLFKSAQTKAMTERRVIGLFFFIDPDSLAQVIAPIEAAIDTDDPEGTADRFTLRDVSPFTLPKPIRVTPIEIIEVNNDPQRDWVPAQIADDVLFATGGTAGPYVPGGTQYHRNAFVVLFDASGRVVLDRAVTIWDPDPPGYDDSAWPEVPILPHADLHVGARTRLFVARDNDVVADDQLDAIPFVPASGVLVYDDQELRVVRQDSTTNVQSFLATAGRPLFIHPVTGRLVQGDPQVGS